MKIEKCSVSSEIWGRLKSAGFNDYASAGIMGNLYAESALNSKNLQQSAEKRLGFTDDSYTEAVDRGTYQNFVHDKAGYGLAQWTYWSLKEKLLQFAKRKNTSIGDLTMQCLFLIRELKERKTLCSILDTAEDVRAASDAVLLQYERPADQSEAVKQKRTAYGEQFLSLYGSEKGRKMTESDVRKNLLHVAESFFGCKESDGSHGKILDIYNAHKPLARGYTVKRTDSWCATFVSAVAIQGGCEDIVPLECGCGQFVELARKMGIWVENDGYVPDVMDIILYDWQDGGNYHGTDNTGWPDHIGYVTKVKDNIITVIEGNKRDAVGYREVPVNGRYIRGYVCPKYDKHANSCPAESAEETNEETYIVQKGDTLNKIVKKYGVTVEEIAALNGIADPNRIYTGQKLKIPARLQINSLEVGSIVNFNGKKHYSSANAKTGSSCRPGKARVTRIYQPERALHPYHLVAVKGGGSSVYGWVSRSDIS